MKIVNQYLEFYETYSQFENDHKNQTVFHIKELIIKANQKMINIKEI